jgi:hypothetical protein
MALVIKDRVQENTSTTGTGTLTLTGSTTGYQGFSSIGNGNTTYYCVFDTSGNWEAGVGTYTASGSTLSRDTVISNNLNTTAKVNLGSGAKVFCGLPAEVTPPSSAGDSKNAYISPVGGTWVTGGNNYTKSTYPELSTQLGSVPDLKSDPTTPTNLGSFFQNQSPNAYGGASFSATNGTTTIVIGANGTLRKTTDGTNFTSVASNSTATFNDIKYLNGNFIAVGASGACCVSSDGNTWINKKLGTVNLNSISYGNSTYVVSVSSNIVYYSSNLNSWSTSTYTLTGGIANQLGVRIAFGAGVFVAVTWNSGNSFYAYTSTDGITWTMRFAGGNLQAFDLVYANSKFLIATAANIYFSTDGIGWDFRNKQSTPYTSNASPQQVATNGTTTIYLGITNADSNYYYRTTDGINWVANSFIVNNSANSLSPTVAKYINGYFVIGGRIPGAAFPIIYYSTDAINWNSVQISSTISAWVQDIIWTGTTYMLVGTSGLNATSTNLSTWTVNTSISGSPTLARVQYNGTNYVTIASGGSAYYSTNGTTWTATTPPASVELIYQNSKFWCASSAALYSSSDGITWTIENSVSTINKVAYLNGYFFLLYGGTISVSTTGASGTWTAYVVSNDSTLYDITWNGTNWAAVGTKGTFVLSTNTTVWTTSQDPALVTFWKAYSINNYIYGFGTIGSILTGASRQKIFYSSLSPWTFTPQSGIRASTANYKSVIYNGTSTYLAVGTDGSTGAAILKSADGISWDATTYNNATGLPTSCFFLNSNYIVLVNTTRFYYSTDATSWSTGATLGQQCAAVAYGGTNYVFVGNAGYIGYGSSLTSLTTATGTGANGFFDVIYANSQFVAVGGSGSVYTSPDGVTWTSRTSGHSNQINKVTYQNGYYFTLGQNGHLGYSTDAITWTAVTLSAQPVNDLIYANGVYVIVSAISGGIGGIYTTNNLASIGRVLGYGDGNYNSVSWDGSKFIITASNVTTSFLTSTDGYFWATVQIAPSAAASLQQHIYAGGKHIAIGTGYVAYSTNGSLFNLASPTIVNPFSVAIRIAGGSGSYVAANGNFSYLYKSTDLLNWQLKTPQYFGVNATTNQIFYNGSKFVAIFNASSGSFAFYAISSDGGDTWTFSQETAASSLGFIFLAGTKTYISSTASFVCVDGGSRAEIFSSGLSTWRNTGVTRSIAYNGTSTYVAVGIATIVSSNGISWTPKWLTSAIYQAVYYVNGNFLVLNPSTSGVYSYYSSDNGATWSIIPAQYPAIGAVPSCAAYGASTYVLGLLTVNTVLYSTSMTGPWRTASTGGGATNDIIYANSIFVAVHQTGIVSSTDAISWTARGGATTAYTNICYVNSYFVATSTSNGAGALVSTDGITWSNAKVNGTTVNFAIYNSVDYGAGVWVGIGWANNEIYSSTDCINWTQRTFYNLIGTTVNLSNVVWDGTRFIVSTFSNFVFTSTNGTSWTKTATTTGITTYMINGGGKTIASGNSTSTYNSANLQYTTDGSNWNSTSLQNNSVPSSCSKLYKLNNLYIAFTDKGTFTSTDAITWTYINNIVITNAIGAAYGNSKWLIMGNANTSSPISFWSSTDGVTWIKCSNFGASNLYTTNTQQNPIDLVFANGNFIASFSSNTGFQGLTNFVYTSSDGITWTGRETPLNVSLTSSLASDGTNVVATGGSDTFPLIRSTDGGATWSTAMTTGSASAVGSPVGYTNGVFFNSYYYSVDGGSTWVPKAPFGTALTNYFSVGDYYITFSSAGTFAIYNKNGSTSGILGVIRTPVTITATNEELPLKGNSVLIAVTPSGYYPYVIMEMPLYSYNTSTTFYTPAEETIKIPYVYAGT